VTTQVRACRSGVMSSAVAGVLVGAAVLLAAASVPLYALTDQNVLVNGVNVVVAVLFSAVGFIVVRRQPRNPVGWILLTLPAASSSSQPMPRPTRCLFTVWATACPWAGSRCCWSIPGRRPSCCWGL